LSDERRLLLSALYLQATRGPLVVERDGDAPAAWRIAERARWQAWRQLGGMPQTQAEVGEAEGGPDARARAVPQILPRNLTDAN